MHKHIIVFWLGIAAIPAISIAAIPIASHFDSPRTVVTGNVPPCAALAKSADTSGRAFCRMTFPCAQRNSC
jgi:hypothetical protein